MYPGETAREDTARAFEAAYNAGDAPALARLFTEDAILIPPDAPVCIGRGPIASYYEDVFERTMETLAISTDEVQTSGGWAFARGTFSATGKGPGGLPRMVEGKWLSIFAVMPDGTMKLARHIWNLPPPAAEERDLRPEASE